MTSPTLCKDYHQVTIANATLVECLVMMVPACYACLLISQGIAIALINRINSLVKPHTVGEIARFHHVVQANS